MKSRKATNVSEFHEFFLYQIWRMWVIVNGWNLSILFLKSNKHQIKLNDYNNWKSNFVHFVAIRHIHGDKRK